MRKSVSMLKNILLQTIDSLLGRKQVVRISKAMLNRALGNNNGNMVINGELALLHEVLGLRDAQVNKFVAFDVGANIGQWATSLLEISHKCGGSTIHCFEPSIATFSLLEAAISKLQSGEKVFCINKGLSNSEEDRTLYIKGEGADGNSLYNRRLEGLGITFEQSEIVQTATLDNYCSKNAITHIDFLKIDVEGHELAVMKGAAGMLKKKAIDFIQFEYGGCWIDSRVLFIDMYDYLSSFGYVIGKIMPKGVEFYDTYDQRLETFQMANFLACKPDCAVRLKRIHPAVY